MVHMPHPSQPIGSWPSEIKFVWNWPVIGSRLGDIGYIDQAGVWRKIINVFDSSECLAHEIKPLLFSQDTHDSYISKDVFRTSNDRPLVKVSRGWEVNFLDSAELGMYNT